MTVDIDDALLAEAERAAARTNRSLGAVVNDALRVSLRLQTGGDRGVRPVELPVSGSGGLRRGVDLGSRQAMAELLDDDSSR
jgi:hypothetical protein